MTEYEWSVAITSVDGNAYRRWLQDRKIDPKVIEKLVGITGEPRKTPEDLKRIAAVKSVMRVV